MEKEKETQVTEQSKQLSYDELRNIAGQLQQQNVQLRQELNKLGNALQESMYNNSLKRLEFLFKVLEQAHMFSTEFIEKSVKEIVDTMTIPESEDTKDTKEE